MAAVRAASTLLPKLGGIVELLRGPSADTPAPDTLPAKGGHPAGQARWRSHNQEQRLLASACGLISNLSFEIFDQIGKFSGATTI